jgi:hypothetical protein
MRRKILNHYVKMPSENLLFASTMALNNPMAQELLAKSPIPIPLKYFLLYASRRSAVAQPRFPPFNSGVRWLLRCVGLNQKDIDNSISFG